MTREEAIARFKGIKDSMSISVAQSKFYKSKAELNELCDMAISALSAERVDDDDDDLDGLKIIAIIDGEGGDTE